MTQSAILYERLLEEIPKHRFAQDAIMAAGFPRSTATKQAKRVLHHALQYQAKKILALTNPKDTTSRKLMSEMVGLSSKDVFNRIKFIGFEQDKDLGSSLKVVTALAREHGVILATDEPEKKAPSVINVIVEKTTPLIEGEVNEKPLENG